MKVTFLGTGTSTGVPQIGCECQVCRSTDTRDRRLRASVLLQTDEGDNLLIDCGPDFYHQILRIGAPQLTALLITHSHYDHVGGVDDLRPYCRHGSFPVYCQADVADDLKSRVPYCFVKHLYPGVPTYNIHLIQAYHPFIVGQTTVMPLAVMHHKLQILGFRVNQFAYITDCKTMPQQTIDALKNIDTLVINALRIEPHLSHQSLSEALKLIKEINPRVAYLTHMSHQMGLHSGISGQLPDNVFLAYDGLEIHVE